MAAIDELFEMIGPPVAPAPLVDWPGVEGAVNLALPTDYKELTTRYAPLGFDEFLGVLHPAEQISGPKLLEFSAEILESARELRGEFPEVVPYPLYPEQRGLFPWGVTDNGDHLFWRTGGDPDSWTVVVAGRDYGEDGWWEFPGSMSEFLVGIMTHKVHCPVLVETFPGPDPKITQYGAD